MWWSAIAMAAALSSFRFYCRPVFYLGHERVWDRLTLPAEATSLCLRLFHRDALREIARLIGVFPHKHRRMIGDELHRHRIDQRGEIRRHSSAS